MGLLVLRTEDAPEVRQWCETAVKRGEKDLFYKWKIKIFHSSKKSELLIVIDAQPLIPPFYLAGWAVAFGVLMIWGVNIAVWIGVVIGMGGYFWTSSFLHHMTWIALRKKVKYSGLLKRVKLSDLVKEVIL